MNEGLSQKLLDLAGVLFVMLNDRGEVTYVNRHGYKILEYDEGELIGRNWFETCLPETARAATKEAFRQLMRGELEPVEYFENPVLTKSGQKRIISWHNAILHDSKGRPIGTLSSGLDVTERKRAEQELRQSERRYETLARIAPVGIFRTDASGKCVYVNDRWCEISGRSSKNALGKEWTAAVYREDLARVRREWQRAVENEAEFISEFRFQRREGSVAWVVGRATPEKDESGAVVGYVGTLTEITERKRTEEALRVSEARLRAILNTAVDGIITINERGIIESVNPALEKLFGYKAEELIGKSIGILMPPQDKAMHDVYLRRYLQTGDAHIIGTGREVLGRKKDGTVFPLHLSVSEFEIDNQRMFTGILHDKTDQKKLQDQMLQTERLAIIGKMAAKVAHEIRNPLSSISLNAELLEEELASEELKSISEEARSLIHAMIREIDRVTALTDEYLQFSRLPESRPTAGRFEELVGEVIESMRSETQKKQIRLEWQPAGAPFEVALDKTQFRRALLNVLRNAIEAMPQGGTVRIWTERTDHTGLLHIQDTGLGIPPEKLEHIFEPFYTTKEFGTGLGLAIAQQVVHEHGGRITCTSAVGKGTTFSIEIPLANTVEE